MFFGVLGSIFGRLGKSLLLGTFDSAAPSEGGNPALDFSVADNSQYIPLLF